MEKTENQLKYENYREQFKRLNRALTNGFYLEAMFIEYALMEDRTESVLRHADRWEAYLQSKRGRTPTLDSKVRTIQKAAEQKKTLLSRYFSDDLLQQILDWKEDRNRLIHALLKQQFAHDEIRLLAERGNALAKALRTRSGNFSRAADKMRGNTK